MHLRRQVEFAGNRVDRDVRPGAGVETAELLQPHEELSELRALGITSTEIAQLLGLDARRVRAKTPQRSPRSAGDSQAAVEMQAQVAQVSLGTSPP